MDKFRSRSGMRKSGIRFLGMIWIFWLMHWPDINVHFSLQNVPELFVCAIYILYVYLAVCLLHPSSIYNNGLSIYLSIYLSNGYILVSHYITNKCTNKENGILLFQPNEIKRHPSPCTSRRSVTDGGSSELASQTAARVWGGEMLKVISFRLQIPTLHTLMAWQTDLLQTHCQSRLNLSQREF